MTRAMRVLSVALVVAGMASGCKKDGESSIPIESGWYEVQVWNGETYVADRISQVDIGDEEIVFERSTYARTGDTATNGWTTLTIIDPYTILGENDAQEFRMVTTDAPSGMLECSGGRTASTETAYGELHIDGSDVYVVSVINSLPMERQEFRLVSTSPIAAGTVTLGSPYPRVEIHTADGSGSGGAYFYSGTVTIEILSFDQVKGTFDAGDDDWGVAGEFDANVMFLKQQAD